MRLLSWNLNGRRQVERQLTAIASRAPDIIALQELTRTSTALWRSALSDVGLPHLIDSFADSPPWEPVGPRKYGVLIASRFTLTFIESAHAVSWPERILSATVATRLGAINVHTTHIPPGCTNGIRKVEMLEAVSAVVSEPSDLPRILCGDFNVPQIETTQGRIVTWAERLVNDREPRLRRSWRGRDAQRWDAAERTIMEGSQQTLIDAFRYLHGYDRQEFSWFVKRKQRHIGRRFDHVFCSPQLAIAACEYIHDVRENGLSDHSALELDFELCRPLR